MPKTKAKELKIYEITNRDTLEKSYQAATSPTNACKQVGWQPSDCFVFEQKPGRKPGPDHGTQLLVKIPCLTCPFQYAECKKPVDLDCPTRPSSPELQNWVKQAAEAHLCGYDGQVLTKNDYNLGQKWLPIAEAIKELTPKP